MKANGKVISGKDEKFGVYTGPKKHWWGWTLVAQLALCFEGPVHNEQCENNYRMAAVQH